LRHYIIAGNWKMNLLVHEGIELASTIATSTDVTSAVNGGHTVVVAPPFIGIQAIAMRCAGTRVSVAAQDCHPNNSGAFTGDISAKMIADIGATHVIVGHSERRQYHGETNELIGRKAMAAVSCGMRPIICIGESLQQREANVTNDVLSDQLAGVLRSAGSDVVAQSIIAYEPVWAIGTGVAATTNQAQETHAFINGYLQESLGAKANVPILYGGSVTPANAAEFFSCQHIDGALVGGASLTAEQFVAIVEAAVSVAGTLR